MLEKEPFCLKVFAVKKKKKLKDQLQTFCNNFHEKVRNSLRMVPNDAECVFMVITWSGAIWWIILQLMQVTQPSGSICN